MSHEDSSIVLLELDETGPSRSDHMVRDPETITTGLYYKDPKYHREAYSASCSPEGFLKGHRPLSYTAKRHRTSWMGV